MVQLMISRVCAWLDLRDKNRLDRAECVNDPRMQGTRLASALRTVQSKLCSPTWPARERDAGVYCTLKEQALPCRLREREPRCDGGREAGVGNEHESKQTLQSS